MNDKRELRIAVAMNGGVSLAVWIGGVAMELNSFVGRRGAWEGALAESDFGDVRIDVLAGTSAGGLNAVFLALAQAYEGVDLDGLRTMWLDLADFESDLMRSPSVSNPISLLDGSYFHDQLAAAIGSLIVDKDRTEHPVDLLVTATSVHGEPDDVNDDFHDTFPGNRYAVLFHFSARLVAAEDFVRVPAAPAASSAQARLVAQLALASRSSSSFPFAFEPWYCDPNDPAVFATDERRRVDIAQARFLMDGGVLDNLPVGRAIDAIFEQPAQGPVKRILAGVVPLHQQPADADPRRNGDVRSEPPSVAETVSSALLGIPRDENDAKSLRSVRANNDAVAANQAARRGLFDHDYSELVGAGAALWSSYRARAAVQSGRVAHATCVEYLSGVNRAERAPSLEDLVAAVQAAAADGYRGWPWLATEFEEEHCWSPPAIRRGAAVFLSLYGMARDAGCDASNADLRTAKQHAHDAVAIATLAYGARPGEQFGVLLGARLAERDTPALQLAVAEVLAPWGPGSVERAQLDTARARLGEAMALLYSVWSAPNVAAPPEALRTAMTGSDDTARRGRDFLRHVEVVQNAFAGMADPSEQAVSLALISPSLAAPIDGRKRTDPKQKLSGDEMAHFGAFLERSWRANDWLWGRLDAATALGRMLGFPDETIEARQAEIVKEEAFFVCDAIVRDAHRGARCLQGARLFRNGRVPSISAWTVIATDPFDTWAPLRLDMERADPVRFVDLLDIGSERIVEEVRTSLGVHVSTEAVATTTAVLAKAGLPGPLQTGLNVVLKPVHGIAAMAYRYARDDRNFARQAVLAAMTAGAGALALADMLNIFPVGALAPLLWLIVLGGAAAGFLRAPLTSVVLGVVIATTGFLYSVDADGGYVSRTVLRYRPQWIGNRFVALVIIAAGFFVIGSRWLAWVDDLSVEIRRRAAASLPILRERFRSSSTGATLLARIFVGLAVVLLPAMKWWQLARDKGADGIRQLVVIGVLMAMLAIVATAQGNLGRIHTILFTALVGEVALDPRPAGRPTRLFLASGAVVLALAGFGASRNWPVVGCVNSTWLQAALSIAALLPLGWLAKLERDRARNSPAADRVLLWTVGPGVVLWLGLTVWPIARGWQSSQSTVVFGRQFFAVGLGEEVVFRGLLLALVVAAGWEYFSFGAVSVAFGLWHIPDVLVHVPSDRRAATAVVTFLAMFLVSHFVFVPLRLRSRSVIAPALVHASWNVGLAGFWAKPVAATAAAAVLRAPPTG